MSHSGVKSHTVNAKSVVLGETFHIGQLIMTGRPLALKANRPEQTAWKADDIGRFHFSVRATKLYGRDAELERLKAFCRAEGNFLWWGVTGKGGAGKSRLALELGILMGNSDNDAPWNWMFLQHGPTLIENLGCLAESWEPTSPTLLIVDYVATVAEELKAALDSCAKNAPAWAHPVRLLFLERSTEGGWHDHLFSDLSNEDKMRLRKARFAEEYLLLDQFPVDQAKILIEELLDLYRQSHQTSLPPAIEDMLTRLDIEHRPLFAMFLADAIAAGGSDLVWDKSALLDQVLKRELDRWRALGVTDDDRKLLRFTTLAGALDLNSGSIPEYAINVLMATGHAKPDKCVNDRWSIILHGGAAPDRIPRLEPDLLGELFVLSEWGAPVNALQWDYGEWKPELAACWEINDGRGVADFLVRAAQDFAGHENLLSLIKAVDLARPDHQDLHVLMSNIYAVLVYIFGERRQIERAVKCNEAIAALVQTFPQSEHIAVERAKAAVNLGVDYGNAGEARQAREMYEAIVALARAFPQSEQIAARQAKAAFNLCVDYGNAGETQHAHEMCEAIAALVQAFPQSEQIAVERANAAVNLVAIYGNAGDAQQAHDLYEVIEALVLTFPQSEQIAVAQAKAAFNLSIDYSNAGEAKQARDMYDAVAGLVQVFPQSEEIAVRQAKAAFNLGIDYGKAGDAEKTHNMYEAIAALVQAFPQSEQIAIPQAKAAVNLSNDHCKAGETQQARDLYEAIAALVQAFPQSEQIAEEQAKAAFNLVVVYGNAGEARQARAMYETIAALVQAFPQSEQIAIPQAKAAFNLGIDYRKAGDAQQARAMYEAISALVQAFPKSEQIAEVRARAAFILRTENGQDGQI